MTRRAAPVVLACALVTVLAQLPYLHAATDVPAGTRFTGTFHWTDDVYHYLSFVQQAESGSLAFRSKLSHEDAWHSFINLEFLVVGRLSALLGGRPTLALRIAGAAALLLLVSATDRLLRACGAPPAGRLLSLLLVAGGGGPGGLLHAFAGRPVSDFADMTFGLYPAMGILANPHWTVSLALAVEALLASLDLGSLGRRARFAALATLLGLVRIYDLGVVLYSVALATLVVHPRREWRGRLAGLAWLVPVMLYNVALFTLVPGFSSYVRNPQLDTSLLVFVIALLPSLLVVLATRAWRAESAPSHSARVLLVCWGTAPVLVPLLQAWVPAVQFAAGAGLPWLALAAIGLAQRGRLALWLALPVFVSTAAVEWRFLMRNDPGWDVPAERYDAALALRTSCRAGDVVLAPPEVGLYAIGLSACGAVASHLTGPDFDRRVRDVVDFYSRQNPPWRARLLERYCVTHLVLPGDAGPEPHDWVPGGAGFHRITALAGHPVPISVYARSRPSGCGDFSY